MYVPLIVLVLVVALLVSGLGYSRYGVGPIGVVLIVLGCLYLTGNLHV